MYAVNQQSYKALARVAPIKYWLVCVRLEIEAQEQALEQLEKSTQEATRKAHDAEQKAKSALDALKVCLSDKLDLSSLAHVDHKHLLRSDHGNLFHTSAWGSVLQQACPGCSTLMFPSTERTA